MGLGQWCTFLPQCRGHRQIDAGCRHLRFHRILCIISGFELYSFPFAAELFDNNIIPSHDFSKQIYYYTKNLEDEPEKVCQL